MSEMRRLEWADKRAEWRVELLSDWVHGVAKMNTRTLVLTR